MATQKTIKKLEPNSEMAKTIKWVRNHGYTPIKEYKGGSFPKETKPDLALTIPEIIARFESGRSINVKVHDQFSGDHEELSGVDIRTLDIVEIDQMLEKAKIAVEAANNEVRRRNKEKQDELLNKSVTAKLQARVENEMATFDSLEKLQHWVQKELFK